jgi:glycosyltransferase involved in cell wall biosynthesis
MNARHLTVLSVVIPLYNEASTLPHLYASLRPVLEGLGISYEVIFVDDGSADGSAKVLAEMHKTDKMIRVLRLSRNFGKEIAITAGLHRARGEAILSLDADGQHPVELIPEFISRWQAGAKVVVGVRHSNQREGFLKRYGSKLFYWLFNSSMGLRLTPGATDYRLIDRTVQHDFGLLTERNRITRGLIDWLGYPQEHIPFSANPRHGGEASYSPKKLVKLAVDSAISLSISPLFITAYIGAVVLPLATLLGLGMVADWLLGDPLHLHATGGAYLTVLVLWLIGVILVSQGIIGLYLSHIHTETQNRPLYVVNEGESEGWA